VGVPGDISNGAQARAELLEADLLRNRRADLDRIAATQDSGAGRAIEQGVETMLLASRAIGDRAAERRWLVGIVPEVDPEQPGAQRALGSDEQLERLSRGETADHAADRSDHPRDVAGFG